MNAVFFGRDARRNYWWYSGALFLLLLLLEFLGMLRPVRQSMEFLLQPVLTAAAQVVRIASTPLKIVDNSLQSYQRVQDLELRYAEALAQLAQIDQLKKENQELRSFIQDKTEPQTRLLVPVVSYGRPYIGAGREKGIKPGDMVLLQDILIGRIGQVSENQAEVVLLSQNNTQPVLARTEQGITGTVQGDGRKLFLAELPVEIELQRGERVMTVGQAGVAAGILIGRVGSIEKKSELPTQRAVIEQVVSFYDAQVVEVRPE